MNIKPLFDKVVIELKSQDEQNGILLPQSSQEVPIIGEVIAIGDHVQTVVIADHVLFNEYACHEFCFNEKKYVLIKEVDILAVVDKENDDE